MDNVQDHPRTGSVLRYGDRTTEDNRDGAGRIQVKDKLQNRTAKKIDSSLRGSGTLRKGETRTDDEGMTIPGKRGYDI